MIVISITSFSLFLALNNSKFASSSCRGFRGFCFICLGVSAAAPLFYLSVVNGEHPYMSKFELSPWVFGGAFYAGTCSSLLALMCSFQNSITMPLEIELYKDHKC